MSSALVTQVPAYKNLGSVAVPAEIVRSLTRGSKYLDRIQLFQGSAGACKQGTIPPGHWGIPSGNGIEDLGTEIDLLIFAVRTKALDTSDNDKVVVNYDAASEAFESITRRSKIKDSGCMSGLEFLVFERSTQNFCTYFAYTGGAQFIAEQLIPGNVPGKDIPLRVTLVSEYRDKGKNSFHVPEVRDSSSAFPVYPTEAAVTAEIEKFHAETQKTDTAAAAAQVAAVSGCKR